MNRHLKWLLIASSIILIIYSAAWLTIELVLCSSINKDLAGKPNTIKLDESGSYYTLTFNKATPYGYPFKFGIKIHQMFEETGSSLVTHHEPVNMGYSLLKQGFYVYYNSKSTARPKPLEGGFGTDIEGEFSHFIHYPLNYKMLKIIKNPSKHFELLNFIKGVEINAQNIKAYDVVNKSLLLDQKYLNSRVDIHSKHYYQSLADVLKKTSSKFHFYSKAQVNNVISGKRIAVGSLIYGILPSTAPSHEIDLILAIDAHDLNTLNLFGDVEIKCDKWYLSNATQDANATFHYKFSRQDETLDMQILAKSSLDIKPGFFENLIDSQKQLALYLINLDSPGAMLIRPLLNDFLENPNKFIPEKKEFKKIESSIDINVHGSNNKFKVDLKDFSMHFDGSGIKITNSSQLDDAFSWKSSGIMCINNFAEVVDSIIDYKNQILGAKYNKKTATFYKDVDKSLLRLISNHPESGSDDIILNYEISPNLNDSKIGQMSVQDVQKLYSHTLYAKAIELVKNEPNPISALKDLSPELTEDPRFIEKLQQAINKTIKPE